jgi:putative addiction module killer protein
LSPIGYNLLVMEVRQTDAFRAWLRNLRDDKAAARIVLRIRRLEQGNPGDAKSVGAGVVEMRIDYGPGYRAYYVQRGPIVVVLLCGGDKRTQTRDVKRAKALAEELSE